MDIYKIGVSIIATNGVSPVLTTIASQMARMQTQVNAIGTGFGSWGAALGVVGGVLAAGVIVKGLVDIAEAGGDVNHQLELMKTAGMSVKDTQDSLKQAMKTSGNVLTTTLSENLEHIRELRFAFGDLTKAMEHLDIVSKANSILNNVKGGGKDQVWDLVKSLEMKNITSNPKEFESYVDAMTKVVQASGGKVTPQMFMSTFKYGRTATLGWDENFITGALPRLIQEYSSGGGGGGSGSGGPGNALMSAYAKIVQGQMTKTGAYEFERMGLGHAITIKGSAQAKLAGMPERDLFMSNPYEWVQRVMMPALKAHGITSDNDIIAQISKMFQVRTASDIMTKMGLQGRFHEGENSPFEKDIRLQKGAMGMPGYDELIKNDYPMILEAFNRQWKNLLETLGTPLMAPGGPVISAMAAMVSVLGQLGQFAGSNMETIKQIGTVIADIGSIIAKVDVAGAKAFGMLVPAFNLFSSIPWASIHTGLEAVTNALTNFSGTLGAIVGKIKGLLGGFTAPKVEKDQYGRDPNVIPNRFDTRKDNTLKAQPISLSLNVDGRALASAVSEQIGYLYEHSTGGPSPNRLNSWASGDSNFSGA